MTNLISDRSWLTISYSSNLSSLIDCNPDDSPKADSFDKTKQLHCLNIYISNVNILFILFLALHAVFVLLHSVFLR